MYAYIPSYDLYNKYTYLRVMDYVPTDTNFNPFCSKTYDAMMQENRKEFDHIND